MLETKLSRRVVAAIAAITSVGTKVLAKWTSLNASM